MSEGERSSELGDNQEVAPETLISRNEENFSLYTVDEEMGEVNRLMEKMGIDGELISIGNGEDTLGYMILPRGEAVKRIVAEAPITFVDYDDTQAKTTLGKKASWEKLEALGLSGEVVRACDKLARVNFGEEGETYEPELDMRLLTFALGYEGEGWRGGLEAKRAELLGEYATMGELKEVEKVDTRIEEIFNMHRFRVEMYPDTHEVLRGLRGDESKPLSNVFALTYGDVVFQLEKTLPLLEKGLVQTIFLTKVRKGRFLRQLFEQNPWQGLPINHHYEQDLDGSGIRVDYAQPILMIDDDPKQVKSVAALAEEMGIPVLGVHRVRSADHKRFEIETPEGKYVQELSRDSDGRLEQDTASLQRELFEQALGVYLLGDFGRWINNFSTEQVKAVLSTNELKDSARAVVIDFFRDNLIKVEEIMSAMVGYRIDFVNEDSSRVEEMKTIKEEFILKAKAAIEEYVGSR